MNSLVRYQQVVLVSVVVLSTVMVHCNSRRESEPTPPPTVVLLVIDTLRTDAIGCYGSTDDLTPNIDRLAADGTRFDFALAPSSWTVPSMASLMSGVLPAEHGVERGMVKARQIAGQPSLSESFVTLAESFKAGGYYTIGIVANAHLDADHGFAQGFDIYANVGFSASSSVLKWFRDHAGEIASERPRFIYVHLFDPHHPYFPQRQWFRNLVDRRIFTHGSAFMPDHPAKTVQQMNRLTIPQMNQEPALAKGSPALHALRAAYESEVAYADAVVERIFDILEVNEQTIVVFTSDHGEEFRDHGRFGHRQNLYSELVHVPLIIRWPGHVPAGVVQKNSVSLVDLYPTILGLAGLPLPEKQFAGVNLWQNERFVVPETRDLFASTFHRQRYVHSLAAGRFRLILDVGSGLHELYDEANDPGDVRDIAEQQADLASKMRKRLEKQLDKLRSQAKTPRQVPLTPELEEQLRNMGYLED